jgi:hypothetical protein
MQLWYFKSRIQGFGYVLENPSETPPLNATTLHCFFNYTKGRFEIFNQKESELRAKKKKVTWDLGKIPKTYEATSP